MELDEKHGMHGLKFPLPRLENKHRHIGLRLTIKVAHGNQVQSIWTDRTNARYPTYSGGEGKAALLVDCEGLVTWGPGFESMQLETNFLRSFI